MAAKAFQKIYTKIENITKATCMLRATGVGNEELATINGRLAQVVRIMDQEVTLQVFGGTEGIPTDAEVIFLGFLSGYLAYHAAAALNHGRLVFVFTVQMAATAVQQVIFVMTVMMARQVFGAESLISFMASFIDNQNKIIYAIYFVSILVPVTLFLQPRPERPSWANPAQYRQLLARAIRRKRWGSGLLAMLVLTILISSIGGWYANKKEQLVPAVAVKAEDGLVQIPLEEVSDGHLHRYAFRASDGTEVRVIIVQKGGSAFGVGLDACEICGPTGYLERDGQIVCRLCDVVMNKATIGLPGGCNPIPVEYRVANGAVQIAGDTLEAARIHFR